jgi:tetratricopeptide (TPR) repeat protein
MEEGEKKHGVIVPIGTKSLTQINNSLTVTYKLLYGDIEELFNKAFCLLNGFENCDKNYLKIFETDPNHLLRTEYGFYTNSKESESLAYDLICKILDKKPNHFYSEILLIICKAIDLLDYGNNCYDSALEKHDRISEDFVKLLKSNPLNPIIYYVRGIFNVLWSRYYSNCLIDHFDQYSSNLIGCANNDFTKAIELAPNFLLAYRKRAKFSDSETAIKDLSKILEIDPEFNNEFGRIYSIRAKKKFQIRDFQGAIDDYTSAISKDPSDEEYQVSRGWMYFQNEEYNKAILDFRKTLEIEPSNSEALQGLIASYENNAKNFEKSNDLNSAINIYSEIISFDNKCANAYYRRGLLKYKSGIESFQEDPISKFDAIEYSEGYIILTIEKFKKYTNYKSLRFESGSRVVSVFDNFKKFTVSDAINNNPSVLEDVINLYFLVPLKNDRGRLEPQYDNAYLVRTKIQDAGILEKSLQFCLIDEIYKQGLRHYEALSDKDYKLVKETFTKAIDLNQNFWGALYYRGLSNYKLGDYEGAIQDFSKAIELNPEYAEAFNSRGLANFALKNYIRAINDYNKAIELNPSLAESYFNRGSLMYFHKRYNVAISDLTKAIDCNTYYVSAYFKRGNVKFDIGDYEGARDDFSKITSYGLPSVFFNRAICMMKLNDNIAAIEDLTKAIELEPTNSKAFRLRSNAKEKIGDLTGAQEDRNEYERLNNV